MLKRLFKAAGRAFWLIVCEKVQSTGALWNGYTDFRNFLAKS
jgi:hypothetical protein